MEKDLFGNKLYDRETFEIVYSGPSFGGGTIVVNDLYKQLHGLEQLIDESVDILVKENKLTTGFKDYEILIKLEEGSLKEKIQVVFNKDTARKTVPGLIVGLIITSYGYFLNKPNKPDEFYSKEIEYIETSDRYKNNLLNTLTPLSNNDDSVNFYYGDINIDISMAEKDDLRSILIEDESVGKNGEFREKLEGVVRRLDLDAKGNNYFGFNIRDGQSKVPMAIKGEFNLNDYKAILDVPIIVDANVRYKNDRATHIEVISYKLLSKQNKIDFESTK